MATATRGLVLALLLAASPATVARAAPAPTTDQLAREVDRAESVRAVKDLQRNYAHYAQFGLWDQMASLFADRGTYISGETSLSGRAQIAAFLTRHDGGGRQGLAPGAVHTLLIDDPLVNLSVDGNSAKARWMGFALLGDGKGHASFEGGIYENAYVRERGRWKIATLHFYPQYEGPYETGWTNIGGADLPLVPFHFTADETGIPIPAAAGPAPHVAATLASLEQRVAALNDADKVRNLQNAYGYYVDRKMWDDVTDLFADNGAVEIGGIGVYRGKAGVRHAMELMGPQGLGHGELNDRLLFDTIVTVAPGGHEAWARGIELGMLGEADKGTAFWEVSVYVNRFVKERGLWKLREVRSFPLFKTDYAQGWGKSRIAETAPAALAPDAKLPAADVGAQDRLIPAFLTANPATGLRVAAPAGLKLVATTPLTAAIPARPRLPSGSATDRLAEVARRLAVSKAWDGAENVSVAYGYFLDESQWRDMGAIFGKNGAKQVPFAGYYLGVDRITKAVIAEYGEPRTTPRPGIAYHWRMQPVINVSADGRSANVRTYLFHPNTSKTPTNFAPGLSSGMYQDQMVLEDGIWRIWNLTLDEPFVETAGWKGGWSGVKPRPSGYKAPEIPVLKKFPPDIPISIMGAREEHFRGGGGDVIEWPGILPMWFPYRNPVSGRTPEHFISDCGACEHAPELSMTRHGYLLPPTGPEPDTDE